MGESEIRIRAYHLGRGECFLVQFKDKKKKRNILIDFGAPASHPVSELLAVANDIAKQSDGKLDAIVITHAHVDRISGFHSQREVFDSIKVREVWVNGLCVDDEDEIAAALYQCRDYVSPFRVVLSETKAKVDPEFKYRLENNAPVETCLDYICDMVQEDRLRYLERTGETLAMKFSKNSELHVHSPIGGIGSYDHDWRQNQISTICSRLESRLEEDPNEPAFTHPMFGESFDRCEKPAHLSDSDFRTLRRKNFILGMSEYEMVEKAIDNSSLVFTLNINGKKLLFAGDITEANWYWMNFCYECCDLDDVDPACPTCEEVQNQWADIDFCKVTSHALDYEREKEMLKMISPGSQLLLSKHPNGETDKLIRQAREKHGSNLTVINSMPEQLWSDIYL